MILLLLISSAIFNNLTLDDISFNVWSGETFALSRLINMSKTWYQELPEINVYMADLQENTSNILRNSLGNSKIRINIIPIDSSFLIGSSTYSGWSESQILHTVSLKYAYEHDKNKKLYIFCDDDSYIFPNALINQMNLLEIDDMKIYGCVYSATEDIERYYRPQRTNDYGFIMGGAGLIITNKMMKVLHDKNDILSYGFNSYRFPSDMKIAAFIDNIVGPLENYLLSLPGQSNADTPYQILAEIDIDKEFPVGRPRISFHRIFNDDLQHLWNSAVSIFDGKIVNWENFSTQVVRLPFDDITASFSFGYAFHDGELKSTSCFSMEQPVPDNTIDPKYYKQRFHCNVTVFYNCDESLDSIILQDYSYNQYSFNLRCPKPQNYTSQKDLQIIRHKFEPFY